MWPSALRWLVLSFCLHTLVPTALSDPQSITNGNEKSVTVGHDRPTENNPNWASGSSDYARKAELEVLEALEELHSLRGSGGRLSRLDKKPGLIGSAVYYAKEAFSLLFISGPKQKDQLSSDYELRKMSKPLSKAIILLESAAEQQNPDAIYLLAEMNFHGNFTHSRNYRRSFHRYQELASLTGNSSAQHMLGFMYATGVGGAVERDQAKATMYHTFAAKGGDTRSEMTVAFRHHAGIGTSRNCNEAVVWYKAVADKAIQYSRSGPPGGLPLQRDAYRIADDDGGVYGEGASFSSSGANAQRGGLNSDQNADFEDVMEYLDLMSRKGDFKATFSLGRLHYDGSRTMERNFKTSRRYFMQVARQYWNKDDRIISEDNMGIGKIAAKSAAYLGRFYLRGEGVTQNYEKALRWFRLGLKNGDPYCQYELGLMHLLGLGVRRDTVLASGYFKEAAQQDWAAAQVNLGKLFLDQGDLKTAMSYFDLASRHGHIEAMYHLAEISNYGVGRERSCPVAAAYYKIVAEKAEALHSSFEEANRAYGEGDPETALVNYMMAAEQGYEQAQANVAYMLDEHRSIVSLDKLLPWKTGASSLLRNAALALIYWTRSAKQLNIDSTVKMGDYYLKGYGIEADVEKAAACYYSAAEMQQSAQALWNLGWMHENGIGVEQDFHLAKRFYDQALETNSESYMPVKLGLLKLRMRSWWNTITHGNVKSIQPDPEEPKRYRTWSEWLANFIEDENPYFQREDVEDDVEARFHDPMPGGDDYYYDEIDASILETLTIFALAGALAFLVYYRQVRQQNHRRIVEEQRRRQGYGDQAVGEAPADQMAADQQADGGFFPPPGDPNFDAWRAGGIGH